MTEQEWLAATDPEPMLEFLKGKATDRKLRLFACSCCRHTALLARDEWQRMVGHNRHPAEIEALRREADLAASAAEVAEKVADGLADLAELKRLFQSPEDDEMEGCYADGPNAAWAAKASAYRARWCANYCSPSSYPRRASFRSASKSDHDREQSKQCGLLRDIFGNLFRPVTIDSAWLTNNVVTTAQAIYDERAFDRLPLLADALEQAGCPDLEMLAHGDEPGEHVRGCWLVDVLLDKE